jgi:putative inorganic carbon (HCO3(-)) transporter
MPAFAEGGIVVLFHVLLFFVPLILFPSTSELFEFNKMVATYALTLLIVFFWLTKMILNKKVIFRRTILDVPLVLFLVSQLLATLVSMDSRTSFLGYYSRFNGGLASSLSYAALYWAWVANMDSKKTLASLRIFAVSALLVSFYGILEHFGIDKDIWIQDVKERVFSTLGQPNWLASWLVAFLPLSWAFILKTKFDLKNRKLWFWGVASFVFFLTVLYTKSRSGLLGLAVGVTLFWGLSVLALKRAEIKKRVRPFLLINIPIVVLVVLVGTPWTPNLVRLIKSGGGLTQTTPVGPALETGGTESGEIRKIVWKGALETWKHYPLLGTGVETFAYSYYNFRPVEHNLVSEWDFLYNKAHNEYLNFMATTGTLGIAAYLLLITFVIIQILKSRSFLSTALLAGYSSLLVTNFFGFSVVTTQIQFFLYPAIAVTLSYKAPGSLSSQGKRLNKLHKFLLALTFLFTVWFLILICRYWYADILFAKGKFLNDSNSYVNARTSLVKAVSFSPHESIFWDELSQSTAGITLALNEAGEKDKANEFSKVATDESQKATTLSPKNVNIKRNRATLFIKLSALDTNHLLSAIETISEATTLAPTDAKLYYNLGLTYYRTGQVDKAIETLEKTIAIKPNYRDARLAYAVILAEKGKVSAAIEELNYILTRISPNDTVVRQQLEELTK